MSEALTETDMINSIIVKLNTIPVTGVENCIKMVDCIQRLGALRDASLKKEGIPDDSDHNG